MDYMTIAQAAKAWGVCHRRVQALISEGRIEGAVRFGQNWAIPNGTQKPKDARIKSGKYIKQKNTSGTKTDNKR